jgi:hypothetical protein
MAQHQPESEKVKRGMPRSLIYAMIPLGFVLLVILMLWGGEEVQEEPGNEPPVEVVE